MGMRAKEEGSAHTPSWLLCAYFMSRLGREPGAQQTQSPEPRAVWEGDFKALSCTFSGCKECQVDF